MSLTDKLDKMRGCKSTDVKPVDHRYGGIYAKKMELPAGHFAISHKHLYDHMSILAKGTCLVVTDDHPNGTKYTAPAMIDIRKNLNHEVVALTDVVWFCIHSLAESDSIDDVIVDKEYM